MIKLKDLEKHYRLWSMDRGKTTNLQSLTEHGDYNVYKYLCHIIKVKTGRYQVPGFEPTSTLETLLENAKAYTASLKYNSEFYNPSFRKGYFEYMVVLEHLRNLGFKYEGDESFTLQKDNVYGGKRESVCISVRGLDYMGGGLFGRKEGISETVKIILYTSTYSWITTKEIPRNPDYIIPEIEGLLNPLFLSNGVSDFKTSEKMAAKAMEIVKEAITPSLNKISMDFKAELISSLKETLAAMEA